MDAQELLILVKVILEHQFQEFERLIVGLVAFEGAEMANVDEECEKTDKAQREKVALLAVVTLLFYIEANLEDAEIKAVVADEQFVNQLFKLPIVNVTLLLSTLVDYLR